MFENILLNVSRNITLTDDEKATFTGLLERKLVPRKTVLLRAGDICQFEAYIVKGCARIYHVDINGCEIILSFAVEDWWISDLASFHEQKPSTFFIEALEKTEILMLSPQNKQRLLREVPKFERVFRILIQRSLYTTQNRLLSTIGKSAMERYLEFVDLYPTVPPRVPQYQIASYIGVSPEFISIIRRRLASKTDQAP
ncbi:Crp/Fnr family transcriptional regulator [Mucilaginibacter defluvii]|uniref:Crp/Fnr family transcriptional regulator n=1 Tax=Mucilaginibacter defluvii TaxID=1196019 RepID=A0ABP9G2Z6_9SPHI